MTSLFLTLILLTSIGEASTSVIYVQKQKLSLALTAPALQDTPDWNPLQPTGSMSQNSRLITPPKTVPWTEFCRPDKGAENP